MRRAGIVIVTLVAGCVSAQEAKLIVPVSAPDTAFFEKHERVALVVGIQDYDEDTGLSKLSFSGTADITGVERELRAKNWHVITLANKQANRGAILTKLKDLSGRVKGDGGTFLFFFSGHGGTGADGRNYLALYDTPGAMLEEEGLAISRVEDALRASGAQRQVLLIDACRNRPSLPSEKKNNTPTPRFAAIATSRGMEALYATAPGEYSYEGASGYSTFTEYLLKGLRGAAAGTDGLVTMDDLRRYVEREVPAAEERRGHVQQPYHRFDSTGGIVLAKVTTAPIVSTKSGADEAWSMVKDSKDPLDFDGFLSAFPESEWTQAAKLRAEMLRSIKSTEPVRETRPELNVTKNTNPIDNLTHVRVPPPSNGTFMMGCSPGDSKCHKDEKPQHQKRILKEFYIGATEVTQAAFQRVMGRNPSEFRGDKRPVESVSWDEAASYCRKIGGRLPTEAEWEGQREVGLPVPVTPTWMALRGTTNLCTTRPRASRLTMLDKSAQMNTDCTICWGTFENGRQRTTITRK